jgi:hypothetical protein
MRALCAGVLVALCSAFSALPASAAMPKKPALHILSFEWEGDAEPQAESLYRALGVRVRNNANYTLGESQQPASSLALVSGCKDGIIGPQCEDAILARLKSERLLWGTVTRAKGAAVVTAEVHLVQKGFPQVVVRETYNARLADTYDPMLQELAAKMLRGLMEAPEACATLRVKTGKVECSLSLDSTPKGETTRGVFTTVVASGMHSVETMPPCEPLVTHLFVPAGGVTDVDFGRGTEPEDEAPLHWKKPVGIGLMGAGALLSIGIGGALFGLRYASERASAEERWKGEAFDTPALDCNDVVQSASATASCNAVKRAESAGNWALVSAGFGLAMVGAGAYFFLTAPKSGVARVRVAPTIGWGSSGATLLGTF